MAKSSVYVSEGGFVHAVHDWYKPLSDPSLRHTDVSGWGPSLTRQEFADDADINVLMSRFPNDGILPPMGPPTYYDFTEIPESLMATLEMLDQASAAFMTLPARVRAEFENDPRAFCDFASDPANIDVLREWGLARPVEAAGAVRVAEPPAAGGGDSKPPADPAKPGKGA